MDENDDIAAIKLLLERDKRFSQGSYNFVNEVLESACIMGVGDLRETERNFDEELDEESEEATGDDAEQASDDDLDDDLGDDPDDDNEDFHVSGQDLCRVAVMYAVNRYGYLARVVLERLGFYTTGDIGDAVYNMISVGLVSKTPEDSREDFDDVFDLGEELDSAFEFTYAKKRR